jgi:uncharacterized protein YdaU (DUF1376 family)
MKARLPHMPFFVNDYLGATRHLTLAERGAYTDLLFLQWNLGPLPVDSNRLASLLGCTPKQFAMIWPAIQGKFIDTDAGLVNERLEYHREKTIKLQKKHRDGAEITNARLAAQRDAERTAERSPERTQSATPRDTHPYPNPNLEEAYQGGVDLTDTYLRSDVGVLGLDDPRDQKRGGV